ncbi:MAG TPA: hypothetical protein VEH10_05090 [Thermoplasmata archaeon]|nr:hypothetical protein [Thermoplasmata archaeon]
MGTLSGSEATVVLVEVAILLVILRRSYLMSRGVPYSPARLLLAPVLILFLWCLVELEAPLLTPLAIPYFLALDIAILVAAALGARPLAERRTQVARDDSGVWTYRIGFSLAALFLVVFLLRLGLALALFPSALSFGAPPGGYPPFPQQLVLAGIDAIFSVSAGLLVGRSWGVARKVGAARRSRTDARPG